MADLQAETIGRICAALLETNPQDQLDRLIKVAVDVGADPEAHGEIGTAIHRLVRSIYRAVEDPMAVATTWYRRSVVQASSLRQ